MSKGVRYGREHRVWGREIYIGETDGSFPTRDLLFLFPVFFSFRVYHGYTTNSRTKQKESPQPFTTEFGYTVIYLVEEVGVLSTMSRELL